MIHAYQARGLNIVIDVYSGSIHIMDDPAFFIVKKIDQNQAPLLEAKTWDNLEKELLEAFPEKSPEELQDSLKEVRDLVDQGLLFSEDDFQNLALDLGDRKTYVKALCLNVAHTCNLTCSYCFASQGKYKGDRALMTPEVAKAAIDFLVEASGPQVNLDVDFFGGEPLMNWDLVKATVAYARSLEEDQEKKFHFTLTTNGLLLNEEIGDYLNKEMDNVVLSLDGRPGVHDRFRKTLNGKGSYDLVVPKFQEFVKQRGDKEYYVRGTYTGHNKDFTEDIFHMADLGFHRLSMEPVIGDPAEEYMLEEEDVPELLDQYDILRDEMVRRNDCLARAKARGEDFDDLPLEDQPFIFYHYMLDLKEGPCIYKRIAGCGSGTEYLAVTPWGDLYPCHQFVGEEEYKLGNVKEGVKKDDLVREFKHCNCYSHPECQDCWAKLYCSGGCPANALHASGDINGTVPLSCDLFRKRMEAAIYIQAHEALREADL